MVDAARGYVILTTNMCRPGARNHASASARGLARPHAHARGYHARHLWYGLCVVLRNLTLVLFKVCLHAAIRSTTLSFPPSYILLI